MPRLSIQLEDNLNERLDKFLPWGTKQNVMQSLCVMLCDAVDKHGPSLIGLILNQEYNLITQEVKKRDAAPTQLRKECPAHLEKYLSYIDNAGGSISAKDFDEDRDPIGATVRYELLKARLVYVSEEDQKLRRM